MIYLYSGTPGSGKSLHAARVILDHLTKKKLPVIANFDINPKTRGYKQRFYYLPNDALDVAFLYDFSRDFFKGKRVKEDRILVVLDECQLLFNSRSWSNSERMKWIEFFSQHRHFGYKIILIAQSDRMIDRQMRALIEIEEKHRKLANYGLAGLLLSLPFAGRLFVSVAYYYGLREKVGQTWLLYKRRYARLYDSYNQFAINAAT